MNLIYTPLIGIPLCFILMLIGVMLCLTIIGIPAGFTCFALANKVLTINK